jgi:hypothetical protein
MSLAALKPKTRSSYSATLFVVSNSSLYEKNMVSWVGEIKTTPTPTPSLEEAPSKKIFQIGVLGGGSSQEVMEFFLISIGG